MRRLLACAASLALFVGLAVPHGVGASPRRVKHMSVCRSRHHRHRARCTRRRAQRKSPAPAPSAPGGETSATSAPTTQTHAGGVTTSTPAPPPAPSEIAPPSVPHVQITAVEYSFTLSRTTVPQGKVVLQFVNHGQDEHNLNAAPAGEGPLAGALPNTLAGEVRNLSVELRSGSYTLFCSLPEHERKGMRATLQVE